MSYEGIKNEFESNIQDMENKVSSAKEYKESIKTMASQINDVQLKAIKAIFDDIKDAIVSKGVSIDDSVSISDYANKISLIVVSSSPGAGGDNGNTNPDEPSQGGSSIPDGDGTLEKPYNWSQVSNGGTNMTPEGLSLISSKTHNYVAVNLEDGISYNIYAENDECDSYFMMFDEEGNNTIFEETDGDYEGIDGAEDDDVNAIRFIFNCTKTGKYILCYTEYFNINDDAAKICNYTFASITPAPNTSLDNSGGGNSSSGSTEGDDENQSGESGESNINSDSVIVLGAYDDGEDVYHIDGVYEKTEYALDGPDDPVTDVYLRKDEAYYIRKVYSNIAAEITEGKLSNGWYWVIMSPSDTDDSDFCFEMCLFAAPTDANSSTPSSDLTWIARGSGGGFDNFILPRIMSSTPIVSNGHYPVFEIKDDNWTDEEKSSYASLVGYYYFVERESEENRTLTYRHCDDNKGTVITCNYDDYAIYIFATTNDTEVYGTILSDFQFVHDNFTFHKDVDGEETNIRITRINESFNLDEIDGNHDLNISNWVTSFNVSEDGEDFKGYYYRVPELKLMPSFVTTNDAYAKKPINNEDYSKYLHYYEYNDKYDGDMNMEQSAYVFSRSPSNEPYFYNENGGVNIDGNYVYTGHPGAEGNSDSLLKVKKATN